MANAEGWPLANAEKAPPELEEPKAPDAGLMSEDWPKLDWPNAEVGAEAGDDVWPNAEAPWAGWPKAETPDAGCPNADVPGAGCPNAELPCAGCPNADVP